MVNENESETKIELKYNKLTIKQQLYVDAITIGETVGNKVQSALAAGYTTKSAQQACRQLSGNIRVKTAIDAKLAQIRAESVATRRERQEFWTKTYKDENIPMSDRLRASELLGKSEADFIDKHILQTNEPKLEPRPEEKAALAEVAAIYKQRMAGEGVN